MTKQECPTRTNANPDPADLLPAIPLLLGHDGADSVVAILLAGNQLRVSARWDRKAVADTTGDCVAALQGLMNVNEADAVVLVAIGPADDPAALEEVFTQFADDCRVAQLPVLWTAVLCADRWWTSDCYPRCGRWAHVVRPMEESTLALGLLQQGRSVAPSRKEILSGLQDLAPAEERIAEVDLVGSMPEPRQLVPWLANPVPAPNAQLAGLIAGLEETDCRDAVLTGLTELAAESAGVWSAAADHGIAGLRCCPEGSRPAVSVFVAFCFWQAGDGLRARVVLDLCLREQPDHRLAGLLDRALLAGVPPSRWSVDTANQREL